MVSCPANQLWRLKSVDEQRVLDEIKQNIEDNQIILFMKGTPKMPQCGFSAQVVQILDECLPSYTTINVLAKPDIREGIKVFSSWPTIPQLYIRGEFVGGCDIIRSLHANGELSLTPDHVLEVASACAILSTHLSLREESRLRSVSLIESLLDPDEPAVLAGDLNARPESPVLEAFRRTWTNATEGQTLITLPLEKPRQIDYVLFRPARCWAVRHTEVIDERIASDHCPVLADLERLELPEE